MKLSKPEYLVGGSPLRLGIIEAGFAAYAPCSTDLWRMTDTNELA
jgi:hypothetical protein